MDLIFCTLFDSNYIDKGLVLYDSMVRTMPEFKLYAFAFDKKCEDILEKENIESRPIWKPMHIQPYYKEYNFYSHNDEEEISVSEDIFNRGVCLPSDTKMINEEQKKVINIIKGLFQG